MNALNHGDYLKNVNSMFRVAGLDAPAEIELAEVNGLKSSAEQDSFSLVFQGGRDRFLPQGLYSLEHESLGSGMIFLVPVGETEDRYLYEAVFNRMKSKNENNVEEIPTGD